MNKFTMLISLTKEVAPSLAYRMDISNPTSFVEHLVVRRTNWNLQYFSSKVGKRKSFCDGDSTIQGKEASDILIKAVFPENELLAGP